MLLRRYHKKKDIELEAKDVNLQDKKVSELKEMAKEKGIEGYSKMKKDELIAALAGD